MNVIFKIMLTFNATAWMIVIYAIKGSWKIGEISCDVIGIILLIISVFLSVLSIILSKFLSVDSLENCQEISLSDGEFLPTYLGYFFVSLSISDKKTMIYVYMIVFVFTYFSQTQYFNPIFLIFGYHYYNVSTERGTKVFIIKRGKVIRNKQEMKLNNLRRINDTTYIELEERKVTK